MRRNSYLLLLLLIPMLTLASCDGVTIGQPASDAPELQVEPDPEPQPTANIEVLVFKAKWCKACQRDKPQVEEMRQRGVKITEIDWDEHPEIFRKYGVTRMPTYIVLEDGVEVERTEDIILIIGILSAILKIVIPILIPLLFG